MLVLSRHVDERIFIGSEAEIKIRVISIRGDKVRLGIEAPKDTPIHREEVFGKQPRTPRDPSKN